MQNAKEEDSHHQGAEVSECTGMKLCACARVWALATVLNCCLL